MRACVSSVCLAIALVRCATSSGSSPADAGDESSDSSSTSDTAIEDTGSTDANDEGVDAALVCSPTALVDAGPAHDAGTEAGAGRDASATDAAVSCYDACIAKDPSAYARFAVHQLNECGCLANGPCYANCHTATTADPASSCGMCLASQTAEGLASTCTLAAAADCSNDAKCTAFQACAGMCPM